MSERLFSHVGLVLGRWWLCVFSCCFWQLSSLHYSGLLLKPWVSTLEIPQDYSWSCSFLYWEKLTEHGFRRNLPPFKSSYKKEFALVHSLNASHVPREGLHLSIDFCLTHRWLELTRFLLPPAASPPSCYRSVLLTVLWGYRGRVHLTARCWSASRCQWWIGIIVHFLLLLQNATDRINYKQWKFMW